MPTRKAEAEWSGDLMAGHGTMELGSGAFKGPYSFRSRMEDGSGTNPEELIGAAHAGCYSMQFAAMLAAGGHPPTRLHTTALMSTSARPEADSRLRVIDLITEGGSAGHRQRSLSGTGGVRPKQNCPVSKARSPRLRSR